ncbi:MAG: coniferyl-aldehyde dehydrogenase [Gammaproteobacteria bacterium]|nr:MAG: coniferyl-aldehyde dehydrogenase [Gammaproteobacteria bacterium]
MATSTHDLKELLQLQQDAFKREPFPSEKLRITQLKALKEALLKHKEKLIKAISADFGHRSEDETQLADIMPTILSIGYHIKHLRHWMKPEKRHVSALFQPASSQIMFQPLGVVGIMAPWNYPVFLTLGPLIAAIAAGNRAMIKPSEFTPYSNRILCEIINDAFSKDEVVIVEGEAEIAAAFSALPFDHLIFTGSTSVGKHVMAAAAKNLTPVTLELGGKSPALIAEDVSADFAVERLLYGKCLNSGQTCVAPDYVLCPESKLDDLIASFKKGFQQLYPDLSCGDYSSVINDRQFSRLNLLIEDANEKGATVISLAEPPTNQERCLPLQLIIDVNDTMEVMQDEIFGPLLPILTFKNIDEAISIIQSKPRPLALYLYSLDKKTQNHVLLQTHAGGVCINDSVNHVAQEDLPFGGVGASGMGKYHGKEGFLTFSASKPILKRGRFYSAKAAFPPYNRLIHRMIYRLFLK